MNYGQHLPIYMYFDVLIRSYEPRREAKTFLRQYATKELSLSEVKSLSSLFFQVLYISVFF